MIDIGVNLTSKRFDKDREAVIARARDAGVSTLIVTGTSLACSIDAITLVEAYRNRFPRMLYCTAGVHPHEASTCNEVTLNRLRALIADHRDKVVAVGETGLDFNRNFSPRADQIWAFERQIELAIDLELPLFLHERDAFATQRDILAGCGRDLPRAVIHCFTGSRESLEAYLELGLWIGITGWICDERRGLELQDAVPTIPPHRLMVETDAPYLLPRTILPRPKNNRNEPAHLGYVVEMIARCCDREKEDVAAVTAANAAHFFRLTDSAKS